VKVLQAMLFTTAQISLCVYVSLIAHGFVIAQLISGFAILASVFSSPIHAESVFALYVKVEGCCFLMAQI